MQGAEPTTPLKTVQNRVRYNVYRLTPANAANEEAWTKLATNLQERSYTDTNWKTLPQGTYYYAVKAIYTGDKESVATLSDSIGNKMLTNVVFNLTTNTTDNEAYGASVVMVNGGGNCYGFASAFAALAQEVGYEPYMVYGYVPGSRDGRADG